MIVVSGLKKIYGSGRTQTAALDGVSLALPDRGMVFVLGLAIRQKTSPCCSFSAWCSRRLSA